MLDITVAVCTAGRRDSLEGTLRSVLALDPLPLRELELLVVDNSREDVAAVKQTVDRLVVEAPILVRVAREPQAGLGFARNAAIRNASGDVVAFIDDDVLLERNWAWELSRAFRETDAAAVGGRIDPVWIGGRPAWLGDDLLGYLSLLDWGPKRKLFSYPNYPFGANVAFRRSVLLELGGFNPIFGVGGSHSYTYEETEVCRRIERAGLPILYAPDVRVHHLVPTSRLTRRYILDRAAAHGRSAARVGKIERGRAGMAPILTKGQALASQRVLRHGARALCFLLAQRQQEFVSEARHCVWNLAWMSESIAIALDSRSPTALRAEQGGILT